MITHAVETSTRLAAGDPPSHATRAKSAQIIRAVPSAIVIVPQSHHATTCSSACPCACQTRSALPQTARISHISSLKRQESLSESVESLPASLISVESLPASLISKPVPALFDVLVQIFCIFQKGFFTVKHSLKNANTYRVDVWVKHLT